MTVTMTTLHGPRTDLADEVLNTLRGQLRGQVITSPDPSGVANTRDVFNAMHVGRPALIAQCSGTADVVDAVNFAREHDLAVAVRGGGHSIAGLSTIDGGMLIDLSVMHAVQVDPEQRLAHVQGGAVLGDLDRETQAFGLATPVGVVSNTGIAGLTLGGGYGWLRRKYGLSCDNLIQAQVVCADGKVRTASVERNPDLFWAIRGGGIGWIAASRPRKRSSRYSLRRDGVAFEEGGQPRRSVSRVPNVEQMVGSGHHVDLGARLPRVKQVAALDGHRQTLGPG